MNEVCVDPDASGSFGERSFQPSRGQFDRVQCKHLDRLPNSGQRGGDELRPGVVIKHDKTKIVRNCERGLLDALQSCRNLGGVADDQGRRGGWQGEQRAHSVASGVAAKGNRVDKLIVDVNTSRAHCLPEPSDPAAAR